MDDESEMENGIDAGRLTPEDRARLQKEDQLMMERLYAEQEENERLEAEQAAFEASRKPLRHPCPANADIPECRTWCQGIVKGVAGKDWEVVRGGELCSREKPQGPNCVCYDKKMERQLASCASPCPPESISGELDELVPESTRGLEITADGEAMEVVDSSSEKKGEKKSGEKPEKKAEKKAEEKKPEKKKPEKKSEKKTKRNPKTAAKGIAMRGVPGGKRRWFLYDTKVGEGFNLQREVFPRAAWIVDQLNKRIKERCEGDSPEFKEGAPECVKWGLVLPPWYIESKVSNMISHVLK